VLASQELDVQYGIVMRKVLFLVAAVVIGLGGCIPYYLCAEQLVLRKN
jgi:hypothetical protein